MAAITRATEWRMLDGKLVDDRPLPARLTDTSEIGYAEFSAMIDRKPQSLRASMMRRRGHERDEGYARSTDILAPAGHRHEWPRTEPFWLYGDALRWAMQTGKLAADGVTPTHYRGSLKKRKENRPQPAEHHDSVEQAA